MKEMNGYNLLRAWYDFKYENPSICRSIHSDLFGYIINLWNKLGHKNEFGLPTQVTMESLGIGSYNTYKKTLDELISFGVIKLIKESKNQHQSKIIAISIFDKASDEATDKALDKATIKASDEATDTIIKQYNNITIKKLNKDIIDLLNNHCELVNKNLGKWVKESLQDKPKKFNFKKSLIDYGFKENLVEDWLVVRSSKKSSNTETSFNSFISMVEKNKCDINSLLEYIINRSWSGFNWKWVENNGDMNLFIDKPKENLPSNVYRGQDGKLRMKTPF
jgi:hypothetical protein